MRAGALPADVESGSPSEDAMKGIWSGFGFRSSSNRSTPNERFSRNCSQETGVLRLDLPAKFRASPLWNVRIIDLLKVEKACLQNPGKMRTSVGGNRREQTHCFHDRHIGSGDLGKHIFFQPGLQRRLRADDFHTNGTQATPLGSESTLRLEE